MSKENSVLGHPIAACAGGDLDIHAIADPAKLALVDVHLSPATAAR